MQVLLSDDMKMLEAAAVRHGVGYDALMEQAGRACADWIVKEQTPTRCAVLCGTGNNGGDGYVAARYLHEQGIPVTVIPMGGGSKTALAQHAQVQCERAGVPIVGAEEALTQCAAADVVVDALFGVGFHGDLSEEILRIARILVGHRCVVALDLPSGLDADSPQCRRETILAAHTLCLGAAKPACVMLPAAARCGSVHLLPIGEPAAAWNDIESRGMVLSLSEAAERLPPRAATANKGTFGKLLTVCGSSNFTGAAALSALSALRIGAGLVTVATTRAVAAIVGASLYEATFLPLAATAGGGIAYANRNRILLRAGESTAVLVGCGMGRGSDTDRLVRDLIAYCPSRLILDADALNALEGEAQQLKTALMPPILTPHVGEMARLTGLSIDEIQRSAPELARTFAREYNTIVVLKDASTVVAAPDGRMFFHTGGNSGLSRGGSGDLLAGMVASLAAQGMEPATAGAVAVTLHGAAGKRCAARRSKIGMLPHELLDDLCDLLVEQEK